MVFTYDQWDMIQKNSSAGCSTHTPQELGRNAGYVFALPARYNFAFPTGYEEVENILDNNPLIPF